jgi:Rad3-related DNA helicase
MRGSFSEGINYTNQESSCVVIIGIPFDNYNNSHCKFKRKYFDKKKEEGEIKINGQKWYEIQAMIYLNQAIGRAIRKKDDYSVICIIDSQISKLKKNLSKWIDKNILIKVTSGDFENHVEKTKEFYSSFNN